MDINLVRNLITVVSFAAFLGIVWWAFAPARKAPLEHLARSILEEDEA
jgi:cbb3-type cytochrome oxidase subunit 3